TSSNAFTPGKLLLIPRIVSSGGASGIVLVAPPRSILTCRDDGFGLGLIKNRVLHDRLFWKLGARCCGADRVKRRRAEQGIALDGAVQFAEHHSLERAFHAVD